jgi:hypothetical protein
MDWTLILGLIIAIITAIIPFLPQLIALFQ